MALIGHEGQKKSHAKALETDFGPEGGPWALSTLASSRRNKTDGQQLGGAPGVLRDPSDECEFGDFRQSPFVQADACGTMEARALTDRAGRATFRGLDVNRLYSLVVPPQDADGDGRVDYATDSLRETRYIEQVLTVCRPVSETVTRSDGATVTCERIVTESIVRKVPVTVSINNSLAPLSPGSVPEPVPIELVALGNEFPPP